MAHRLITRFVGQGRLDVAVETHGTVQIRGEPGPAVPVDVLAEGTHLSLLSRSEVVGEWDVSSIGIQSLQDGFAIRAEGEEFVLKTDDDVSVAREIGLVATSPRMARRVAASQNPDLPPGPDPVTKLPRSSLAAIGFALGGFLVLAGGLFLRDDPTLSFADQSAGQGMGEAGNFWLAFVIGGGLMVGVALVLATRTRWSRVVALLVVVAVLIVFGLAAQNATPDSDHLLPYGFIAGGAVVGVAVVFGGALADRD